MTVKTMFNKVLRDQVSHHICTLLHHIALISSVTEFLLTILHK